MPELPYKPIGPNHTLQPRYLEGVLHGFAYTHPCKRGIADGWLSVRFADGWRLVSEDPVTIEPSVLCPVCGDHGFIREGRWVAA